jgi:type I restriction enzyme S subunit
MRPYLRAANVTWGGIDVSDVNEMDFTDKEMETYRLREGDILLSEASGSASEVGKPAIFRGEVEDCGFQNTLIRVRAPQPLVPFLHLQFLKDALTGRFAGASRGVGIHHLGAEKMSEWEVVLPPIDEQRLIVAAIETQFTRLDAAVTTLERVKANLKRARASILKAAVEGRLVPAEAELARAEGRPYEPASVLLERILEERKARWPKGKKYVAPVAPEARGLPVLPEGWAWTTVDQLTEFVTSGSRGWSEFYSDTGAVFIRSQDINTFRLDLSGVALVQLPDAAEGTRTRVYRNDVLIIITGANVTISALVDVEITEAYVNQHVALCRPVEQRASPFLHLWLCALGGGKSQLEQAAYGAGKPGLNLTNVRETLVGVPCLAEQARIVAEVDRRLSLLDKLDATVELNLARCARLRQSILKCAFEGKLVPQDPRDEPASVLLDRIQSQVSRAV